MRLSYLPSEFQKALPILEKIKAAGFEAYFVGGSVRDALLNRPIHDVDIASSSYPEETKQIFERTVDIGIEHGTVLVLENGGEYEVTTFRTEDVYVDYRRPSSVSFVRSLPAMRCSIFSLRIKSSPPGGACGWPWPGLRWSWACQ